MVEEQFKPIIADNYYNRNHFWFELDHAQTSKLLSLLASLAVAPSTYVPQNTEKWRTIFQAYHSAETREEAVGFKPLSSEVEHFKILSMKLDSRYVAPSLDGDNKAREDKLDAKVVEQDEKDLVFKKLEELAHKCRPQESSLMVIEDTPAMNDIQLEEKSLIEEQMGSEEKNEDSPCTSSNCQSTIAQVVENVCCLYMIFFFPCHGQCCYM